MKKDKNLETDLWEAYRKTARKCKKCGSRQSFLYTNAKAVTCHTCGNLIYRSDKIEFEEKLKKEMKKKW